MKLVEIHWVDSCACGGAWEDIKESRSMKANECMAAGYVVADDEDHITLAQVVGSSRFAERKCLNLVTIPRGCISGIEIIREWEDDTTCSCGSISDT